MHRVVVCVACLAACRMNFDPLDTGGSGGDASTDGGFDASGSDAGTDSGVDAAPLTCPASYSVLLGSFNQSRYRVVNDTEEWDLAEADCEADGHHLAIPNDMMELNAMYTALVTQNIWIGVTDRVTEGTYRTVTGGVQTFLPWAPSEPDPEDCIYIDGLIAQLVAQDCTSGRRYICECDGAPADPSSY